ncbi:GNAT family N-acetyltransferase [Pseudoxanthomonas sangjuensis]|uniref:GNAT family N-acetyltransferase n=1 Tax=Pseudoxanthomonas sangjuensis TaxID=1503750 RepID=UPI0013914025|nr:GNAT family N-acetyltransferase [Pseudoxanthomonas sangjuensis]KAF1715778.1 GNAT family N-acetyltransferase [Pseudoxanthomonas sangjuensis]
MTQQDDYAIRHRPEQGRFTTEVDGHEAELVYRMRNGRMVIEHTGVPEAIGGRGIAAALVKAALEHARADGLKVAAPCSYAALYIRRHPEYESLLM